MREKLTDDVLDHLHSAAVLDKDAEQVTLVRPVTLLLIIAEVTELRALLATELPQRFSVWRDEQNRIGFDAKGESFVFGESHNARALGAALIRAARGAISASEEKTTCLAPPINCTCDQQGDYCPAHATCACGCQRHAHRGEGACIAGKMNCHGCDGYKPARLRRFEELCDDDLERATIDDLRLAYKELRANHVEETTALWTKITAGGRAET